MPDSTFDLCFMDVPEGRAFYPFSYIGRGYLVDAAKEDQLKRLLKRFRWFVPILLPVFLALRDVVAHVLGTGMDHPSTWVLVLVFPLVLVTIQTAVLKWAVRGLAPTAVRMTFGLSTQRSATHLSPLLVGTSMINGTIIFAALAVLMIVIGERAMAVLSVAAGALTVGGFGLVARAQSRQRDGVGASHPRLRQP